MPKTNGTAGDHCPTPLILKLSGVPLIPRLGERVGVSGLSGNHPRVTKQSRWTKRHCDYSPTSEKLVIATSPSGNSATILSLPPTASIYDRRLDT